jgi:hypothetical protein
MSRNAPLPDEKQASSGRRIPWGLLGIGGMLAFAVYIWRSPVYSFHPMCTYSVNARVTADVEIGGETHSAAVVHQNSGSRQWIAIMNSAGCKQDYGTALVYRLADDRVLIVPARLCYAAVKDYAKSGTVDILQACTGDQARHELAYWVDSATQPGKWRPASHGVDFRMTRMTAVSTWSNPTDDIASVAPNLLTSRFQYDQRITWANSPESILSYSRRRRERQSKPDPALHFDVEYDGN